MKLKSIADWELELGAWARNPGPTAHSPADCQSDEANSSAPREANPFVTPWLDSVEQSAMACEFEVLLNHGQYEHGIEIARDALQVVHQLEDLLSVYRPTSEFSTINRFAAKRAVAARYDTLQLLQAALTVSQETGRAFDITAGRLSEVWGFSRRQGRKPNDADLQLALQNVGSQFIEIDDTARTVRLLRDGVQLNPGGIGKGYALDRVAKNLKSGGIDDFLIHGGRSSVAAYGHRRDQQASKGWWIALAHPLRWEEKLGRVRLLNRALGTSGAGKQFFHYQGVRYSHVIDPRTGWPAQQVLSATALCASGTLADALATAFMVWGAEETKTFCEKHPSIGAILVSQAEGRGRLEIELINVEPQDWVHQRELDA